MRGNLGNLFLPAHLQQQASVAVKKIITEYYHVPKAKNTDTDEPEKDYDWDIVWFNVFGIILLTGNALYGAYVTFFVVSWKTFFWAYYLLMIGVLGGTAGAHRLWCHKTYKANLPLKILLTYFQTTCFQNSTFVWTRDHRMHHKYSDTDADPHNASRGLFFSHVGWLMIRKHPEVKEKGKTMWLEDLKQDPVVMFQHKYYLILMPIFCFIIPAVVPWYFWDEPLLDAWHSASAFRYMININGAWCINSFAHLYGMRPYDQNIMPRENTLIGYFTLGEGWHNYHHVFPWDYKASEFKGYLANVTIGFIDLMAKIGWAYDLKSVPPEMVRRRMLKTGDGSGDDGKMEPVHLWGWDDDDMKKEDKQSTTKLFVKEELKSM